jgi:hypothetical protein
LSQEISVDSWRGKTFRNKKKVGDKKTFRNKNYGLEKNNFMKENSNA